MASLVKWLFGAGAHDVTGAPVATGSVYFYVPGSSVEITVYADPDETTPLAQPVVLDASGRAEVYVAAKCEVKVLSQLGATVALAEVGESVDGAIVDCTWGSTARSLDYVLTQLETNLGADAKYLEGGTNSVARTYQDAIHTSISPKDFGATWDGIADDKVPLQRAIDRAIATKLPLLLPPGTCKCTGGLTVNGDLRIIGPGKDNCLIYGSTTGFDLFTVDSGSDTGPVDFSGFGALVPTTASDVAISVTRCYGARFDELGLTGTYGIEFANGCSAIVSRTTATLTTSGTAFTLSSGVECQSCVATMDVGGAGVGFNTVGGSTLIGCNATGGTTPYYVSGSSTTPAVFIRCDGNADAPTHEAAAKSVSIGCSWNPVPGLVSGTPVTADFGTITRVMVEEPLYRGGVKTVTFMINIPVEKYSGVTVTLGGVAAMATTIENVQASINAIVDTAAAQVRHLVANPNDFTIKVVGTAAIGGCEVFVTVKGY